MQARRCLNCGGFGLARGGVCWICDGTGVEQAPAPPIQRGSEPTDVREPKANTDQIRSAKAEH